MQDRGGVRAAEPKAGVDHLFLREEQMRQAQDLLFFAYRDFTAAADAILGELGLGGRTTGRFTSSGGSRGSRWGTCWGSCGSRSRALRGC